jgi:hypothetical protein
MRVGTNGHDQQIAQRPGELQVLNVPGMNNVKTPMAMHDNFSRLAGGIANGQQLSARNGFAIGSHWVTIGGKPART